MWRACRHGGEDVELADRGSNGIDVSDLVLFRLAPSCRQDSTRRRHKPAIFRPRPEYSVLAVKMEAPGTAKYPVLTHKETARIWLLGM